MKFTILYILGYLLCAILTKLFDYFILKKKANNWEDVSIRYIINFTSWVGVFIFTIFWVAVIIIFSVQYFILKVSPKIDLEKPPKWL